MIDPETLRNATEDDVEAALRGSYVELERANAKLAWLRDYYRP